MDILSKETRSWNMSRIRAKNTKPELIVRSILHKAGYRFSLHVSALPGSPDIALRKHKTVIFVHGCFWHRHPECKYAYTPKSRQKFWQNKFKQNVERHEKVVKELRNLGWKVGVVWECEISDITLLMKKLKRFLKK